MCPITAKCPVAELGNPLGSKGWRLRLRFNSSRVTGIKRVVFKRVEEFVYGLEEQGTKERGTFVDKVTTRMSTDKNGRKPSRMRRF